MTSLGDDKTRRELILYATPTGPLADRCAAYFAAATRDLSPTTAQTYPPHCTLTGFFRRTDAGVSRAIAEIGSALASAGPVPDDAVTIVAYRATSNWVGLELQSAWLCDLAATVAAKHTLEQGDDALRLKDWLHLSLAYGTITDRPGTPVDLTPYAALADALIDPATPVGWEVGLWERAERDWICHDTHSSTPEPSN